MDSLAARGLSRAHLACISQAEIDRLLSAQPVRLVGSGRAVRSTAASRGWRVPMSPDWGSGEAFTKGDAFSKSARKPLITDAAGGQLVRTPMHPTHPSKGYPPYANSLGLPGWFDGP